MTVHDDGLFYVTYDNVLPAVRAEYARVGLDDSAITDDDIMAVTTDTLTWMLYHEYEEYIPETPWEWSEFAIDYHITSHMAHALTWPLGIWAEDIIGFANDDFDYYTYSQNVYNLLVANLQWIDGEIDYTVDTTQSLVTEVLMALGLTDYVDDVFAAAD